MMEQLGLFDDIKKAPKARDWTGNSRSVPGCLGASNRVPEEREANDFYATDPSAIEWLMKLEELSPNVWECACGQGHLAIPLIREGYNVRSTDLIDRGFGVGGVDFLKISEPWNGDIITNPPYKYALEFVEHALELVPNGRKVCMFLKVQFLEGKNRRQLFKNTPPVRVWVSSSRIACLKNAQQQGPSMIAYAWYIWEKGYHGDTVLKWFN